MYLLVPRFDYVDWVSRELSKEFFNPRLWLNCLVSLSWFITYSGSSSSVLFALFAGVSAGYQLETWPMSISVLARERVAVCSLNGLLLFAGGEVAGDLHVSNVCFGGPVCFGEWLNFDNEITDWYLQRVCKYMVESVIFECAWFSGGYVLSRCLRMQLFMWWYLQYLKQSERVGLILPQLFSPGVRWRVRRKRSCSCQYWLF